MAVEKITVLDAGWITGQTIGADAGAKLMNPEPMPREAPVTIAIKFIFEFYKQ